MILTPRFVPGADHSAAGKRDGGAQQTRCLLQLQVRAAVPVFLQSFAFWNNSEAVPEFCKFAQVLRFCFAGVAGLFSV